MNTDELRYQLDHVRQQREADLALFNEHAEELTENLHKSEEKCEQYETENRQLKAKILSLQNEMLLMHEQIENTENQDPVPPRIIVKEASVLMNESLLDRYDQVQTDHEKAVAEKEELISYLRETQERLHAVEFENESLKKHLEDSAARIESLISERNHLNGANSQLSEQINQLQTMLFEMNLSTAKTTTQGNSMFAEVDTIRLQMEEKWKAEVAKSAAYCQEIMELSKRLNRAKGSVQGTCDLREIRSLRDYADQQSKLYDRERTTCEAYRRENTELRLKILNTVEGHLSEFYQSQVRQLTAEIEKLSKLCAERADMISEFRCKIAQIPELVEQIRRLELKMSKLKTQKAFIDHVIHEESPKPNAAIATRSVLPSADTPAPVSNALRYWRNQISTKNIANRRKKFNND